MNRGLFIFFVLSTFLLCGCETTTRSTVNSVGLGDSFSIRVASGTLHLHVESKMTKKPDSPFITTDKREQQKSLQDINTETEVLNLDMELAAGQSYRYSLGQNEHFGALVERIGTVAATYEVSVNGKTKTETIESDNHLGKAYSASTVR